MLKELNLQQKTKKWKRMNRQLTWFTFFSDQNWGKSKPSRKCAYPFTKQAEESNPSSPTKKKKKKKKMKEFAFPQSKWKTKNQTNNVQLNEPRNWTSARHNKSKRDCKLVDMVYVFPNQNEKPQTRCNSSVFHPLDKPGTWTYSSSTKVKEIASPRTSSSSTKVKEIASLSTWFTFFPIKMRNRKPGATRQYPIH